MLNGPILALDADEDVYAVVTYQLLGTHSDLFVILKVIELFHLLCSVCLVFIFICFVLYVWCLEIRCEPKPALDMWQGSCLGFLSYSMLFSTQLKLFFLTVRVIVVVVLTQGKNLQSYFNTHKCVFIAE